VGGGADQTPPGLSCSLSPPPFTPPFRFTFPCPVPVHGTRSPGAGARSLEPRKWIPNEDILVFIREVSVLHLNTYLSLFLTRGGGGIAYRGLASNPGQEPHPRPFSRRNVLFPSINGEEARG